MKIVTLGMLAYLIYETRQPKRNNIICSGYENKNKRLFGSVQIYRSLLMAAAPNQPSWRLKLFASDILSGTVKINQEFQKSNIEDSNKDNFSLVRNQIFNHLEIPTFL